MKRTMIILAGVLSFVSILNAIPLQAQHSNEAQTSTDKEGWQTPKVTIFDLRGRGAIKAENTAQENSKKGALIALITSDNPFLAEEIERVFIHHKISGRDRLFIVLGDKPEDASNSVVIFANGEFKGFWKANSENKKVLAGEFSGDVSRIYDAEILPLLAENSPNH